MKRHYNPPALTLFFTSISMVSIILPNIALGQTTRTNDETQSVLVDKTTPSTNTTKAADETNDNTATTSFVFQGSRFQGVMPGVTANSQIVELLGEPRAKIETGGRVVNVYAIEPYDRVGIVLRGDIADSIHLHYKQPVNLKQAASELGLDPTTAVTQTTSAPHEFLLTWPDEGISLHFQRSEGIDLVSRVAFTTAQPDAFLLRGLNRQWRNYNGALHDARAVQSLDPRREEAYRLEAQVALRMGQTVVAKKAIAEALAVTSVTIDLLLLQVQVATTAKELDGLILQIRAIRNDVQLPSLTRAKAAFAMGEINTKLSSPNYKQAFGFHSEANQRARELLKSSELAEQFGGLELMVNAHLAIAHDIAYGEYTTEEKNRAVPKWIELSWKFTAHLLANNYHDQALGLDVCRSSLELLRKLDKSVPLEVWEDRITQQAANVLKLKDTSTEFINHMRWQQAMALYHATIIARQGKDGDRVQQLGLTAYQLFRGPLAANTKTDYWNSTPTKAAIIGLCYTLGSVEAIDNLDHVKAIQWYDQALQYLDTPNIQQFATKHSTKQLAGLGWHGERLVSMGLSYWSTGNKTQGLRLTQQGIAWIETAVRDHDFPNHHLKIPYSNLAVMTKSLEQRQDIQNIANGNENSKQR
ncbi:MAG: hypothetical protein HOB73_04540 [Planctomycetaceae bacterium]|jgi:hypothetical protein|nr:hypothetical protein [Planctomycetaceae bacterium]